MLSVCSRAPAKHPNKTSSFPNFLHKTNLLWVTVITISTGPSVNITFILNMYTFIFVLTEEVMLSALVV